jgi:hypothetical protein
MAKTYLAEISSSIGGERQSLINVDDLLTRAHRTDKLSTNQKHGHQRFHYTYQTSVFSQCVRDPVRFTTKGRELLHVGRLDWLLVLIQSPWSSRSSRVRFFP